VNFKTILTTATTVALMATTAVAQEVPEEEVNPFPPIAFGETISGFLTAEDDTLADGSYYETFLFTGEQGESVTVSLNSLDFNAHALLADSMDTIVFADGDGGGSCNAHLNYVLPAAGFYTVFVTTLTPHETGEFQVSLNKGTLAAGSTRPCAGFFDKKGTLAAGDSTMGTLGPPDPKLGPSYYQVWGLELAEGQTVTIDLQSIIFDARLTLYRGFSTAVNMNDDGGGSCNARLVVTGDGHPYEVLMTTGKEEETGPYLLRVTEGALPIVQVSQCEG